MTVVCEFCHIIMETPQTPHSVWVQVDKIGNAKRIDCMGKFKPFISLVK